MGMDSRNKRPEELGKNRLLSLAMVMKDIQDEIDRELTVSDKQYAKVKPYATNDYFWSRDDCFGRGDTGGGSYSYNKEDLKKTRLEMLDYLRIEGVVVGIDLIKETREVNPEIESFVNYDFHGSWYVVRVNQPAFTNLYTRVTEKAQPYLNAYLEQTTLAPTRTKQTKKSSNAIAGQLNQSDTSYNKLCEVSLRLKGKILRLYINNTPGTVVKRFKSKNAINIQAYWQLQNSRGSYLTKDNMKISQSKSNVKDLPKTMGITGLLADYFIDIDTKGQRLRIPKDVKVTQEDLEILLEHVKRKNIQKQRF